MENKTATMTADKKAKELVMQFKSILLKRDEGVNYHELLEIDSMAKQCAIIACKYAQSVLPPYNGLAYHEIEKVKQLINNQ